MPSSSDIKQPLLKYLLENGERRVSVNREGKPAHSIVRLVGAGKAAAWSRWS